MIDAIKDTPIEYSKQSRDYQVLALIYTILFNQPKMFADLLKQVWTDNIDNKLLDLRAYTLNFIPKYSWENTDLRGVTNSFRYLLRTKGTRGAIIGCLEILARVKGIPLTGTSVELLDNGVVRLIISEEIDDVGNIEDLLRYILPAGTVYEIVKYSRFNSDVEERIVVDSVSNQIGNFKSVSLFLPSSEGWKKGWYLPTSEGKYFNSSESTMDYFTTMLISDSEEGNLPFRPGMYTITPMDSEKVYGEPDPRPLSPRPIIVPELDPSIHIDYNSEATRDAGENAGAYYMRYSGPTQQGDLIIVFANGIFTIRKKVIEQVIANDSEITYGDNFKFTYTAEGVVAGDDLGCTYTLDPDPGTSEYIPVGDYTIVLNSEAEYVNYTVESYKNGTLKVKKKPITIKLVGSNSEVVYDKQNHSIIGYDVFVGTSEDVQPLPSLSALRRHSGVIDVNLEWDHINGLEVTSSEVGTYDQEFILSEFSCGNQNYTVTFEATNGKLIITPRPTLIYTDSEQHVTYGFTDPIEWNATNLVDASDKDGFIVNVEGPDSESDIGEYTIILSGSSEQGNYKLSFRESTMIVDPFKISVLINDSEKLYGEPDPDPISTYELSSAETSPDIPGIVPMLKLLRVDSEAVGTYEIYLSSEGISSEGIIGNYKIVSVTNGTFTIR